MQNEVLAAIITGGATAVIAPITTLVLKKINDSKIFGTIEGQRRAIVGTWRGNILQEINGAETIFNLEITFTGGKKIIKGDASFISPSNNELTKLKFTGGFYHQKFIKLEYKNQDEVIIQFGSTILDLSANGRKLNGKFIGYGSLTNSIVVGEVTLNRVM